MVQRQLHERANDIGPPPRSRRGFLPVSGFAPCGTAVRLKGAREQTVPSDGGNTVSAQASQAIRVDLALVERGPARAEKAKRAVMAGQVFVNGQKAAKARTQSSQSTS